MTSVKKIKVALLALVAALVIAIPTSAFAGTIEFTSDVMMATGEKAPVYKAYQIFDGDYDATANNLSNVTWAGGIDSTNEGLATAIADVFEVEADTLKVEGDLNAAKVAKLLGDNSSKAEAFAAAVAPYVAGEGEEFTQVNDETAKTSTFTSGDLDAGYWIVLTETAGETSDGRTGAFTKYITLLVPTTGKVGDKAKASVPEVEKGVIEDSVEEASELTDAEFEAIINNYGPSADYDIAQGIPYYIAGTLPSEYDRFNLGYYYKFEDTMATGLDLQTDSVAIWVYYGDTPNRKVYDKDLANTNIAVDAQTHALNVTIANLKNIIPDTEWATHKDAKIVVFYKAKLNKDCVVGNPGNKNDVKLIYSNNPNKYGDGDETGETPKEYAVVFTFGVDENKIDANNNSKTLAGAEFYLKCGDKWAVVDRSANNNTGAKGVFVEWVDTMEAATKLVTEADGVIYVKGLDSGSYSLYEHKAPASYNLPDDHDFEFNISSSLPDGETVKASAGEGGVTGPNGTSDEDPIAHTDGYYNDNITNAQGTTLPSTGGIGTTIFTIVGIALIVAAAAIMVIRRRNAAAIQ